MPYAKTNSCRKCQKLYLEVIETEGHNQGMCRLCETVNRWKNPTLDDPLPKAMGITDANDPRFQRYVESAKRASNKIEEDGRKTEQENSSCGDKKKDKQK